MDLETLTSLSSGARFFRADLHVHSYGGSHDVRDATATPENIVREAASEGLSIIAMPTTMKSATSGPPTLPVRLRAS